MATTKKELEQRVSELEADRDLYKMAAQEGNEIVAELSTALAVLHGEELKPCKPPCAGHLGPKAAEAVDKSLRYVLTLEGSLPPSGPVRRVLEAAGAVSRHAGDLSHVKWSPKLRGLLESVMALSRAHDALQAELAREGS